MYPRNDDTRGDQDAANGVQPPLQSAATSRHEDTEAVDEDVIAVILPQDMYLARLGAKGMTIQKEHNLDP
jgi:hypothetical protein